MTFTRTKTTGNGRLDFRLEIAGWPHEWTTHPSITHNSGRDEREVFPGLQYTGLKISEKAVLKDCWSQCSQLTVKIKPTTTREETLDSFTRTAEPVAYLAPYDAVLGLDFDSTAWSLDGAADLPTGFYHIASETIYRSAEGPLVRARWSTTAQRHYISYGSTSAINVPIYAYPPTMEGRRAVLYVYGEGDDKAGDGNAIWRGIVARPPALDSDGITWTIQIDPIIKALEQNVAASEGLEYHIRGIYHHGNCPVRIKYGRAASPYDTTVTEVGETSDVTGFFEDDSALENAFNTAIATLISNRTTALSPTHTSEIAKATYYSKHYSNNPEIVFETNGDVGGHAPAGSAQFFSFWIEVQSYLEGYCSTPIKVGSTTNIPPSFLVGGPTFFPDYHTGQTLQVQEYFGDGNKEFSTPLGKDQVASPIFTYPLASARAMLGAIPAYGQPVTINDPANPTDRLYLDLVDGIEVDDILLAKNGDKSIPIKVTGVDTTSRYITAQIQSGDSVVWFDSGTKIIPLRIFADDATMADFLQGVQDESVNANDGDSPYVPPGDVDVSRFQAAYASATIDTYWKHRTYAFQKPTAIKRIIQEELKAIGYMTRVEANGEIGCTPLPLLSQNSDSIPLMDKDILLPARGMTGDWIRWQAQADGLVNNINVRLGYDPGTDDYDTKLDFSVRDISSIAEHKTNGTKGSASIAPVSTQHRASLGSASLNIGGFGALNINITYAQSPTPSGVASWVQNYLRVLSMDYATVTVQVPFTFFDVLIGDLLSVTCSMIPNGLGRRGVTAKKAMVIGRDWNLDPAHNGMGTLTLYFPREVSSGYAPSGHITSQSNVSGNTWDIHCDGSDLLNVLMSENADGNVHKHFAVGDKILIVQRDSGLIPLNIKGVVITSSPSTIRITTDTTWTPGTDEWLIEFQIDDGTLTTHQQGFMFVANTLKQMHNGAIARRYL